MSDPDEVIARLAEAQVRCYDLTRQLHAERRWMSGMHKTLARLVAATGYDGQRCLGLRVALALRPGEPTPTLVHAIEAVLNRAGFRDRLLAKAVRAHPEGKDPLWPCPLCGEPLGRALADGVATYVCSSPRCARSWRITQERPRLEGARCV